MNEEPVTNLKVQDLNQPNYQLKVIFENKNLGEMNKNVYLEQGVEAVYAVKMDKKGSYKLAFRSSVPIAQAAPIAPQQQVVVWGAPAPVAQNTQVQPAGTTTTTTVVEETVTTSTNANANGMSTNVTTPDGESVSMNVTTDGFGFNMNVQTGNNVGSQTVAGSSTVTTTTTTTTTTSGGSSNVVVAEPVYEPAPCSMLSPNDFEAAKSSIGKKTFEDSKLTTAKQVTQANCLSAAQVKSIMDLFTYEETKLSYAKFAYAYCYEQNKYYIVNDAFTYESSIDELDKYLSAQR